MTFPLRSLLLSVPSHTPCLLLLVSPSALSLALLHLHLASRAPSRSPSPRVAGLRSKLVAQSEVNVWVDPPPIFRAMFPKRLMYETGNSVLRTTLNMLQNTFLQGLARDYERWATDKAYRETRKKLSA